MPAPELSLTLALVALPAAASSVAALSAAWLRRHRDLHLDERAGDWLRAELATESELRCGVSPESLSEVDAYWPHARAITLQESTWRGLDVDARAIAAHELGHAREHLARPRLARALAGLRRVGPLFRHGFLATALSAALFGNPVLALAGVVCVVLASLTGLGTLVEELLATQRALPAADNLPSPAHRRRMRRCLWLGWSVYLAEWSGLLLATIGWWAMHSRLAAAPLNAQLDTSWLAWAVLLLLPVLVLYSLAHVGGALGTDTRSTEFRLAWTAHREQTWSFHAASVVALWGVLAALAPETQGTAPLVALAALPAMEPLSQLGRGLLLLPLLLVLLAAQRLGLPVGSEPPTAGRPGPTLRATELALAPRDPLTCVQQALPLCWMPLAGMLAYQLALW